MNMKNITESQTNIIKTESNNRNLQFQQKIDSLENEQKVFSQNIRIIQDQIHQIIQQENTKINKITQVKSYLNKSSLDYDDYILRKHIFENNVENSLQSIKKKLLKIESFIESLNVQYDFEFKKNKELRDKYLKNELIKSELEINLEKLNEIIKKKYWANNARLSIVQQIELANQEIISWTYRLQRQSILLNDSRRKLFNAIQDIKGNIRTFCRIRPPKEFECNSCFQYDISEDASTITIKNSVSKRLVLSTFNFDYIFSPFSTQKEVFEEISQLIQSVLDGYNVCIFSYGQTGSGKTYTMLGGSDKNDLGVVPRSVNLIFEVIEKNRQRNWDYQVECSAIEIYNENIRDLILNKQKAVEIKINKLGNNILSGVSIIKINDLSDINKILDNIYKSRAQAYTRSNERSSRSHVLIQLKIVGKHFQEMKGDVNKYDCINSTLSLIDLAGSERVDKSGVSGERMKETQFINKSLSALGDVIQSIILKKEHIPYRNSKLTMILKDSLGGSSKTAMLVHVSPTISSLNETIGSLRFASKVQNCDLSRIKYKD